MVKSTPYYIILIIFHSINSNKVNNNLNNEIFLNKSEVSYYDYLYNSIDNDFYNMSLIYNKSYIAIIIIC